ncbi:massive surface protein MspG [Geminocystis sp. NIES-3708]|nr:massive surface protein MspG [Geminocystis sp. NIES-3708]
MLFKALREYKETILKGVALNRLSTQELENIHQYIKANEGSIRENIKIEKKNIDSLINRNKLLKQRSDLQKKTFNLEVTQGDLLEKYLGNQQEIREKKRDLVLQQGAVGGKTSTTLNGSVMFVRELEKIRLDAFRELRQLQGLRKGSINETIGKESDKVKPLQENIKVIIDKLSSQVLDKQKIKEEIIRQEAKNYTTRLMLEIPKSIRDGFQGIINNNNNNILGGNNLSNIQSAYQGFGENIKGVYEKLATINFLNKSGITNQNTEVIKGFLGDNVGKLFQDSIKSVLQDIKQEIKGFFNALKESINNLNNSIQNKLPRAYPDIVRELNNIQKDRDKSKENTRNEIEKLTVSKSILGVDNILNKLEQRVNNSVDNPDPFARVNDTIATVINGVKSGIIDKQIASLILKDKAEENLTKISEKGSVLRFIDGIVNDSRDLVNGGNDRVNEVNKTVRYSDKETGKYQGIIETLNNQKVKAIVDNDIKLLQSVNLAITQTEDAINSLEFSRKDAIAKFKASFADIDNDYLNIYTKTLDSNFENTKEIISNQSDSFFANRRILELELEKTRESATAKIDFIDSKIADIISAPVPTDKASMETDREERKIKIAKLEFDKQQLERSVSSVEDKLKNLGDLFGKVFREIGNSVTDSIKGFFDGIIDGRDNALDAIRDIPKLIQKILVRNLIDRFIAPFFKPFSEPDKTKVALQKSDVPSLDFDTVGIKLDRLILELSENYSKQSDVVANQFDSAVSSMEQSTTELLEKVEKIKIDFPFEELDKFYRDLLDKLANTVNLETVNSSIVAIEGILKGISGKLDKLVGNKSNYSINTENEKLKTINQEIKNNISKNQGNVTTSNNINNNNPNNPELDESANDSSKLDSDMQWYIDQVNLERKQKKEEENLKEIGKDSLEIGLSGVLGSLLLGLVNKLKKDKDKKDKDDDDDNSTGGEQEGESLNIDDTIQELLEIASQLEDLFTDNEMEGIRRAVRNRNIPKIIRIIRHRANEKGEGRTVDDQLKDMGLSFFKSPEGVSGLSSNILGEQGLTELYSVLVTLSSTLLSTNSLLQTTNSLLQNLNVSDNTSNLPLSVNQGGIKSSFSDIYNPNSSINRAFSTSNGSVNPSQGVSDTTKIPFTNPSKVPVANTPKVNPNTPQYNSLGQQIPNVVYEQLINAPEGSTTRLKVGKDFKYFIRTAKNVAQTSVNSKYTPTGSTLQYTVALNKQGLPILTNAGMQFVPTNPTANNPKPVNNENKGNMSVTSNTPAVNSVGKVLANVMTADNKFWSWLANGISSNKTASSVEAWLRVDGNAEKIQKAGLTIGSILALVKSGGLTGLLGTGMKGVGALGLLKGLFGFNDGGTVGGYGLVNAALTPNELVIPASQAKTIGYDNLELINNLHKGNVFSGGGKVKGGNSYLGDTIPALLEGGSFVVNNTTADLLANHVDNKFMGGIFGKQDYSKYNDTNLFGTKGLMPFIGGLGTLGLQLWGIMNPAPDPKKAKKLQYKRIKAFAMLNEVEKSEGAYLKDKDGNPTYWQTRNEGGIIQRLNEGGEVFSNVSDIEKTITKNTPEKPKTWLDYLPMVAMTGLSFLAGKKKDPNQEQERIAEKERIKSLTEFGNDPFLANKRITNWMKKRGDILAVTKGLLSRKDVKDYSKINKRNIGGIIDYLPDNIKSLPNPNLFSDNLAKGRIFKGSGLLKGWGNSNLRDVIPAQLKAGDYVVNADSTRILRNNNPKLYSKLTKLNSGGMFGVNPNFSDTKGVINIDNPIDLTPVSLWGNTKKFFRGIKQKSGNFDNNKIVKDFYKNIKKSAENSVIETKNLSKNIRKSVEEVTEANKSFNLGNLGGKELTRFMMPEMMGKSESWGLGDQVSNFNYTDTNGLRDVGLNIDNLPQSLGMDSLKMYSNDSERITNNIKGIESVPNSVGLAMDKIPDSFARAFNDSNMTPQEITVDYNVKRINNVDYVSKEEFMAGINYASQAGANIIQNKLKFNPNYRKNLGF